MLKKINCSETIIWTDANYKTEEKFLFIQKLNMRYVLNDVKIGMKELDRINVVHFMDAINQKIKIQSWNKEYLDVAFFDKF